VALAFGALLLFAQPASSATVDIAAQGVLTIDGAPSFPIGLSDPPSIGALTHEGNDGLDTVTSAGVRVFRVVPTDRTWGVSTNTVASQISYAKGWDAAAASRGALTMVWLARLSLAAQGTVYDTTLRRVVSALAPGAGLGLWKGFDEPFQRHKLPAQLAYAYQTTHALDPAHPVDTIEAARGTAEELAPYSAVTDAHGVDVYPISFTNPQPSLVPVGLRTALMASITPNHAVTTTLGICTSKSWDHSGSGKYVVPTFRQMRFMAYDAISHGARALFFFGGDNEHCFGPGDASLGWNWTYWPTLARLIGELAPSSRLYGALISPHTGIGVRGSASIYVTSRRSPNGDRWVIAENRTATTVRGTITNLPDGVTSATPYPSGSKQTVSNNRFTTRFRPWTVHVYLLG
jgi:hypothetical protein